MAIHNPIMDIDDKIMDTHDIRINNYEYLWLHHD